MIWLSVMTNVCASSSRAQLFQVRRVLRDLGRAVSERLGVFPVALTTEVVEHGPSVLADLAGLEPMTGTGQECCRSLPRLEALHEVATLATVVDHAGA